MKFFNDKRDEIIKKLERLDDFEFVRLWNEFSEGTKIYEMDEKSINCVFSDAGCLFNAIQNLFDVNDGWFTDDCISFSYSPYEYANEYLYESIDDFVTWLIEGGEFDDINVVDDAKTTLCKVIDEYIESCSEPTDDGFLDYLDKYRTSRPEPTQKYFVHGYVQDDFSAKIMHIGSYNTFDEAHKAIVRDMTIRYSEWYKKLPQEEKKFSTESEYIESQFVTGRMFKHVDDEVTICLVITEI